MIAKLAMNALDTATRQSGTHVFRAIQSENVKQWVILVEGD